ncbi:hypothetical protein G8J22_02304 [Lentilactobacillus hilgardii]|nr:hypothetical protein G8J22_02304 [Lentilactobacillus hilgardii]TDG81692.1 hypothetical protein C5L34_000446 [Lentilactobacillus hilgardii]
MNQDVYDADLAFFVYNEIRKRKGLLNHGTVTN